MHPSNTKVLCIEICIPSIQFVCQVISGQQLPKPGGSSADKEVDPSVVVEVVGLFCDRSEERTQIIPGNGK